MSSVLWACGATVPRPTLLDEAEPARNFPVAADLIANGFADRVFRTTTVTQGKRCLARAKIYTNTIRTCIEDVPYERRTTVEIDLGTSSLRLFRAGLSSMFQQVAENDERAGDSLSVVKLRPSLDYSTSHGEKSDRFLPYRICQARVKYGLEIVSHQGDVERIYSDWTEGQAETGFRVMNLVLFPVWLVRAYRGEDTELTDCFDEAFSEAESKAFSDLSKRLMTSTLLRVVGTRGDTNVEASAQGETDFNDRMTLHVDSLLNKVRADYPRRIIVGALRAEEVEPPRSLRTYTRQLIVKRVAGAPVHSIIQEHALEAVLRELDLKIDDVTSVDEARQISVRTGADTLLVGVTAFVGQWLTINLTLMDLYSGDVLASEQAKIYRDWKLQHMPAGK